MNIIFLDTETTDLVEPRLVQLAYKNVATGSVVNEYFKPPVPISFGSMATHHITEEMVADKPTFEGSPQREELLQLIQDSIVVAHNAEFDIATLANEGVGVIGSIDTEQVARHLIVSDRYALQYIRYALHLNVSAKAHDALGDVLVLEALFYHLKDVAKKTFDLSSDDQIVQKMMELSTAPVLLTTMVFGKYKGKSFIEVLELDKQYLEWMYGTKTEKGVRIDSRDENLVNTLKFHLHIE